MSIPQFLRQGVLPLLWLVSFNVGTEMLLVNLLFLVAEVLVLHGMALDQTPSFEGVKVLPFLLVDVVAKLFDSDHARWLFPVAEGGSEDRAVVRVTSDLGQQVFLHLVAVKS